MKKALVFIAMLIATPAFARTPCPYCHYNRPVVNQYQQGYNNGYREGKSHERDKIVRKAVGTTMVVVGAFIVYKAITGNEPKLTYRF